VHMQLRKNNFIEILKVMEGISRHFMKGKKV
jgi:hypothetical protein